ncbi:asparagine synthase-related protein [Oleiagrimonas sp. C23AA]|uniref:asparagine synthase-related protein n=1 Tax=Oleiagrimonas sp. C23AA TaxID=2719047 RepID=UPI001424083B|nr:asparagine synthase-related protein [Oleiagrimonas sp. C23AA]NII09490.1 hypothetical protein [Oleiagrimonas sp. C23AA]
MLREAITTAVQAKAETDRHVLLELSGGLDSSIVGGCLLDVDNPGPKPRHGEGRLFDLCMIEIWVRNHA